MLSIRQAAVLAYAFGGLLILLIMRMLGEMAVLNPDSGSFSTYADRAIGVGLVLPLAGCIGVLGLC
jgi:L-asparagine transporter-like permease